MFSRLGRWFGPKLQLRPHQAARLDAWRAIPAVSQSSSVEHSRFVVVDVETSGLSLRDDRLISIGAVAMVNGKVALGDSFYIVLQQQSASEKGNILLHGIGTSEQLEGVPPADALLDFLEFLGKAPLIAFHVTFDETMIRRALREYLGFSFKHPWLDLAYVMPGMNPPLAKKLHALDDWIGHFGIRIDVRHNALADAMATAQLFQVAMSQAAGKKIADFAGLRDLEKSQRWVNSVS
jgi:DNA polymerase III subunit epsilon